MLKIDNTQVFGLKAAIRGMRNPLNSWDKSDSEFTEENGKIHGKIGMNDQRLMERLIRAGDPDAKFMRMITVWCDIVAPEYWWQQFDTYKVGTVRDSCSKMHTIHRRPLTIEDFSTEWLSGTSQTQLMQTIETINMYREMYIRDGYKDDWWQMIQPLPMCFNQKATVCTNYQTLRHMYHQRQGHKLYEWQQFCDWIEETLPLSELITMEGRR